MSTPSPAQTGSPAVHRSSRPPARALIALAGTLLGLALLFSFRTPDVAPIVVGLRSGAPTATPTRPDTATPADPSSRPTTSSSAGEVTGSVERTPYGEVQVEVKLSGNQIVDVIALQLPDDRRRSVEISQYVEPILHQEALQAQSAQIDLVSGATWTSQAYQASLENALTQAGVD